MRLHVQAFRQRQKDGSCKGAKAGPSPGITIIIEDPSRRRGRHAAHFHSPLISDPSTITLADRSKPAAEIPGEDEHPLKKSHWLQAPGSNQGHTGACYDVESRSHTAEPTRRPLGVPSEIDQGQAYKCAFYNAMAEWYNSEPNKRPPGVLLEIDQGHANKPAFHNAFSERFNPDPELRPDGYGKGTLPYSCLSWLVSAINGASQNASDVIADAVLSMALSVVGSQRNDTQLLTTAQKTYQNALTKINRRLVTLKASDTPRDLAFTYLPLACFACAWVEVMANRSMDSFNKHMDGIASLIESCDTTTLASPALQALLWEHKSVYIIFSFLNRRPDFYSKPIWVAYFDAKAQEHRYSYFVTLISIACQIPVLLEQYDTGLDNSTHGLGQLIRSATQIDKLLNDWKADYETNFPVPLTTESPSLTATPFPTYVAYPSFGVALSLLYYYAFRSYIYLLLVDVASDIRSLSPCFTSQATRHALACASNILASMSYCQDSCSGVVGKSIGLFPFDSAWLVYLKLHSPTAGRDYSSELAFCKTTAERFQELGITLVRDRFEEHEYCLRKQQREEDAVPLSLSSAGTSVSSETTAVELTEQLCSLIEKRDSLESWERWHKMFDKDVVGIENISRDDENDSA